MTTKQIEIRDRGTCIPALAILVSAADGPIMQRAGFGHDGCVYLIALATEKAAYDPYSAVWGGARTMKIAHLWLTDEAQAGRFDLVPSLLDVRVIIGETTEAAPADCV